MNALNKVRILDISYNPIEKLSPKWNEGLTHLEIIKVTGLHPDIIKQIKKDVTSLVKWFKGEPVKVIEINPL